MTMTKTLANRTDGLDSTMRAVLSYALANAPRGSNEHSISYVRRILAEGAAGAVPSYVSITIARAKSDVNVSFSFDAVLGSEEEHTDGSLWSKYRLAVGVSWPSHGSVLPSMAVARAKLITDAAVFAAEVETTFNSDVWHCYVTSARKSNNDDAGLDNNNNDPDDAIINAMRDLIDEQVMKMKVNAMRFYNILSSDGWPQLPDSKQITVKAGKAKKTFSFAVGKDSLIAVINRVA